MTVYINAPWGIWHTTAATTTTTAQWINWNDFHQTTSTATSSTYGIWFDEFMVRRPQTIVVPTEAQREAMGQQHRAAQQAAAKHRRERDEADARAESLLLQHLDEEQRHEYLKHRHFHVSAPSGQRYRIRRGRIANVDVLDARGNILRRLCAHPGVFCPDQDTMLAQKLMLHFNEAEFVRTANVH